MSAENGVEVVIVSERPINYFIFTEIVPKIKKNSVKLVLLGDNVSYHVSKYSKLIYNKHRTSFSQSVP